MVGCASITENTNQNVSVQTRDRNGSEVIGANYELSSLKGKWFVLTLETVGVNRSNDDLRVLCRKDGYESGKNGVMSETKGMMFGNIVFSGPIGATVDHSSGAAYEYPSFFQIIMAQLQNFAMPNLIQEKSINQNQSSGNLTTNSGLEKKLRELKYLFDEKLITKEACLEQQKIFL